MSAHCKRCGHKLTDPYSIAVGLGPECRGKMIKAGAHFPKAKYRVRDGKVEFIGLESSGEKIIMNGSEDGKDDDRANRSAGCEEEE